jgi:hypothetical protein
MTEHPKDRSRQVVHIVTHCPGGHYHGADHSGATDTDVPAPPAQPGHATMRGLPKAEELPDPPTASCDLKGIYR